MLKESRRDLFDKWPPCEAKGCLHRAGRMYKHTIGKATHFRFYCLGHWTEYVRLVKGQRQDYGSGSRREDARFYYASKRGFHAY